MVCDTENPNLFSGDEYCFMSFSINVPLPTPLGPQKTRGGYEDEEEEEESEDMLLLVLQKVVVLDGDDRVNVSHGGVPSSDTVLNAVTKP